MYVSLNIYEGCVENHPTSAGSTVPPTNSRLEVQSSDFSLATQCCQVYGFFFRPEEILTNLRFLKNLKKFD